MLDNWVPRANRKALGPWETISERLTRVRAATRHAVLDMGPRIALALLASLIIAPLPAGAADEGGGVSRAGNIVVAGGARISVISPTLLRIEWVQSGAFTNEPTLAIANRVFPAVDFTCAAERGNLVVRTAALCLTYRMGSGAFRDGNLQVSLNGPKGPVVWKPGMPNAGNLKGTTGSLDGVVGPVPLQDGVLSRDGWYLLDDSAGPTITATGWPKARTLAQGAPNRAGLDWYLFGYGSNYKQGLNDFVTLSGRVPMLPRWTFGTWVSRYWPYKDSELRDIADRFRREGIPLDVLVLDVDWHTNGWTGWDFSRTHFPDPQSFLDWAHARGYHVTVNDHPSGDYTSADSAFKQVCQAVGWDPAMKRKVNFDLTDPKQAAAYFKYLVSPLHKLGIDFWWIDGAARSSIPGVDSQLWTNSQYYTNTRLDEGKRGFVYSRYGGIGNQRYPAGFSGDTFSVWPVLNFESYFTATAGNVGMDYWSNDIGGYHAAKLTDELYARWVQFGAFSPIFRLHGDHAQRLPWNYGPVGVAEAKRFLALRYQLIPYLYTASREAYDTGMPLCRPMYLDDPTNPIVYSYQNEYMLGNDLLVAPIGAPGAGAALVAKKVIWIPKGTWYDIFTGLSVRGPQELVYEVPLDRMPVFARAGAVVPMAAPALTSREQPADRLDLEVYPGADGGSSLYEDDGETLAYQTGAYATTALTYREAPARRTIVISPELGSYSGQPAKRGYEIRIHSAAPVTSVLVGGRPLAEQSDVSAKWTEGWVFDASGLELVIRLAASTTRSTIGVEVSGDFCTTTLAAVQAAADDMADLGLAAQIAEALPNQSALGWGFAASLRDAAEATRAALIGLRAGGAPLAALVAQEGANGRLMVALAKQAAASESVRLVDRDLLAEVLTGVHLGVSVSELGPGRAGVHAAVTSAPSAVATFAGTVAAIAPAGWLVTPEGSGTIKVAPGTSAVTDLVVESPDASFGGVAIGATLVGQVSGAAVSQAASAQMGHPYIHRFWVIGPFDNGDEGGVDRAYPPEASFDPSASYEGGSGPVRWVRIGANSPPTSDTPVVDLLATFGGGTDAVGYALASVWVPEAGLARILIGSDDGAATWVNGTRVLRRPAPRALTPDQDDVRTKLQAGWNRILVKVAQVQGDWSLSLQVLDVDGGNIPGLRVAYAGEER
jgi:hypothetical protein